MNIRLPVVDKLLKEICIKFLYLLTIILLIHFVYYLYEGITLYYSLLGIYVTIHAFFLFIPYRLNYNSLKQLIPIYLVFISIALYPFVFVYWKMGHITAFIWYLIIPVGAMAFFSARSIIGWSIYVFALMISIFIIGAFVKTPFSIIMTDNQVYMINILTIISCSFLICFFAYYINKINTIKIEQVDKLYHMEEIEVEKEKKETDKYEKIYNDILEYFEKEKPYCNPDFTISQLANNLNSNVSYVSKAIKYKEDINFNIFINKFRIRLIKEYLDNDYQNKYTIKYIYTSAGFRHQSTFNKVFKQIEGVTPSEYISRNKPKIN